MLRRISALDLPEAAKQKLCLLGYEHFEDLEKALLNRDSIPESLQCVIDKYNLTAILNSAVMPDITSAVDLWNFECCNPPVAIFHKGLDNLLRGGFPVGRITEICGTPGSGKTQICFQSAIDVQIPFDMGGSAGEALFISTDLSFRVERLRQMAEESVKHISKALTGDERGGRPVAFSVQTILNGVNVVKICGHEALLNVIMNLDRYLTSNIKLLVIDSFSLPLVSGLTDVLERTKLVHVMLDKLLEFSMKYKFAVVVTNQLTTLVDESPEKRLIPSLGESFGHRLHKRILLDEGKALLMKSIDQPQLFTQFQITEAGIR